MELPSLVRVDFHLELREDCFLPEYKGSTFRGGFGNVFKKVVCALKREDCTTCMLAEKCIYVYIFATRPPAGTDKLKNLKDIPRPYIIEPPMERKRDYKAGDTLVFNLVLVGKAIEYLPYFVYSFEELGHWGLGKGRGAYSLTEVRSSGNGSSTLVYDGRERKFSPCNDTGASFIEERVRALEGSGEITFRFETPTRIEIEDRLIHKPEFHHIFRGLLRRVSNLLQFHCSLEPSWDFRELCEKAQGIKTTRESLIWYDWERYSTRQQRRMTLGGFMGEMTCSGDFSPFLLPLVLGEWVHIGKNATFGLGKYSIIVTS